MSPIEARLARLERQNRRFRNLLLLAAIALLAVLGWGAGRAPDTLQARRIEILNEEGKVTAVLDSDQYGGQMRLYTSRGEESIRLLTTVTGSELVMRSLTGEEMLGLYAGFAAGMLRVNAGMLKVGSQNLGSTVITGRTIREGE